MIEQPTRDDLLEAAAIMRELAAGHCSIGHVPKAVAERRLLVADWLMWQADKCLGFCVDRQTLDH